MIDRALFISADGQTFDGKRAVPNEAVTKLMLDLADLKPGEKVLEIGTGSGYQTAALAEKAKWVYSVDVDPTGCKPKFDNVTRCVNDGKLGWHQQYEQHMFDCIFVTCGMTSIPPPYEEQLREGGRLIIPLGKPDGQELLRLEKRNGKLAMGRVGGYCRFQMAT